MKRPRVLIFGGKGMLGHKLAQTISETCETLATVRETQLDSFTKKVLADVEIIPSVAVEDFAQIQSLIKKIHPAVIVNCVGIVKQLPAAQDYISSIAVNALFPHQLAQICRSESVRLIALSTDCVFSGKKGMYTDSDTPDPVDLYGRTKYLGEVPFEGCLTIRTSMIGRQLTGTHGLLEWFLNQPDAKVKGYKNAIFSGLTTNTLSQVIAELIFKHPQLCGIWQVAAQPIAKFDLLHVIKDVYNLEVSIEPDTAYVCDRSLNGERFREATSIVIPDWTDMITQMYRDPTPYPARSMLHVK